LAGRSPRDLEPNGVPSAGTEVIAFQVAEEPTGLYPDDRFLLHVEGRSPAKDLQSNHIRLRTSRAAGKRLLDHEA
jgi:hypothetical protein